MNYVDHETYLRKDHERVITEKLREKNIIFISTKNLDYIRNIQEVNLIQKVCKKTDIIGSNRKSYLKRLLFVYTNILKTNFQKYDVVFIGFAPQLIIPLFYWKFRQKTIVEDFFISFYDTLVWDRKMFDPQSRMAGLLKKIDIYTLNKAEMVIADTKAHKYYFVDEFGKHSEQIYVYYLQADKKVYYPRKTKKSENLKNKYVVLYFGSIIPLQGINIILEAVKYFKNKEEFFFEIIGPISKKYEKPIQDNVTYIRWLSQNELAEHIANADLCLAGHFNDEIGKAKRTIPGKAYIYNSMEKEMVMGDNSANREVFNDNENVCFVPMGNATKLKEAIEFMRDRHLKNG